VNGSNGVTVTLAKLLIGTVGGREWEWREEEIWEDGS
jgi:hypothetical protein